MELKNVFVQRTLHWSSKQLVVQISVPKCDKRKPDMPRSCEPVWFCWVDIKLVPGKRVVHDRSVGIDGWQSLENAMQNAQQIIEEKYPEAYLFELGDGRFFSIMLSGWGMLDSNYYEKLRKHVADEWAKKLGELCHEMKRDEVAFAKLRSKFRRFPP